MACIIPILVGGLFPHLKNMLIKLEKTLPKFSGKQFPKIFELPPPSRKTSKSSWWFQPI